ncbi:aspartate/glutamate racemase family protein [Cohnella ginsengisoli]|uniref:Aspartate/glutamate racemase family protein n=1 Tax=Cohnella ginsengisoli TaxID=425004 RepID=A0A9X4KLA7_9BACL|nr:aspartate/glutamate racemase family protein [Cohnella ginsengisoli]MDG0793494.1 aspartate/glutamate racemase family protein [Cohnella ginsengisoli]
MRTDGLASAVSLAPRGKRIGMLTPSSNTVLEPVTSAILMGVTGVTVHYSRLRVTQIALSEDAGAQFAAAPMLAAARMLADALVDVIVWNGTAGSWLGLDYDRELCAMIAAETGVPATTSALALADAYAAFGVRRIGLVTPYTADVNEAIAANYALAGLTCPVKLGCGLRMNEQFACVEPEAVEEMIRIAAASPETDAVAVVCTNMDGARLAAKAERAYGKPILDSVATTAWQALALTGMPQPKLTDQWGRVFAVPCEKGERGE